MNSEKEYYEQFGSLSCAEPHLGGDEENISAGDDQPSFSAGDDQPSISAGDDQPSFSEEGGKAGSVRG